MKNPSFFEGVAIALIASVLGAAMLSVLAPVLGVGLVIRLLIAILGFAYVAYLLRRSRERIGRVIALSLWLIAASLAWVFWLPLWLYLLLHVAMAWLIRSLYYYSSILPAVIDLGLNGLSLLIAVWVGMHTNSNFLSIWCFFLLQALFVVIPRGLRGEENRARDLQDSERFESAHRVAEAAVRKLSSAQ